jgi:hypothetical protein
VRLEAPATRASTRATSGAKDAVIIGQVATRASLTDALLGSRPPWTCSPRTSAYSSASQYTSNVTTTETTSAVVDTWPPTVSRIAAVTMAP